MQNMYDEFLLGFFYAMEQDLLRRGAPPQKVKTYVKAMKKRIDKQTLINETYPCISKIPLAKLETDATRCFVSWAKKIEKENRDLSVILQ